MCRPCLMFCAVLALTACGGRTARPPAPAPVAVSPATPAPERPYTLPPIPLRDSTLKISVIYPRPSPHDLIESRDSNFIFGSVGSGRAALTINGIPVKVEPNGAFLAFLVNPPAEAPRYEIVATRGADTARLVHPVRVLPPRPVLALDGKLVVDSASASPRGEQMLRDDEMVRVSIRAPVNASVRLHWPVAPADSSGAIGVWLVSRGVRPGVSNLETARLARTRAANQRIDSTSARYFGDSELFATDVPARRLRKGGAILAIRGTDSVRIDLPPIAAPPSDPAFVILGADSTAVSDTDRVVIGRPTVDGTYKWFLLPGTVLEMTGRSSGQTRVRLDRALEIWIGDADARPMPSGFAAPRRVVSNARTVAALDWVDLVLPIGERPAYSIEEQGSTLSLTLYGTQATTDIINYGLNDTLVKVVSWEQVAADRARYTVQLSQPAFGYLVMWDRGSLRLRIRRPPRIDRAAPLRGLTIAVDPGHPPMGATGPTGLYEGDAVLPVGFRVKELLEQRGAIVVMTRVTRDVVALGERPIMARRANAHALVSIHLNAHGDGINPYLLNGTGTYFFHPQSEPLARTVQRGMVHRMGLRDLGVNYDNLALTRPTWMPAILCEGAFLIMPAQEAAMRTVEFQNQYALGIVEGLENYFSSLRTK